MGGNRGGGGALRVEMQVGVSRAHPGLRTDDGVGCLFVERQPWLSISDIGPEGTTAKVP